MTYVDDVDEGSVEQSPHSRCDAAADASLARHATRHRDVDQL
jgi:hypothetical protein